MNYPKRFDYPEFLRQCAEAIGKQRHASNAQLHQEQPQYARGGKDDEYDTTGTLGELIARLILFEAGIPYTAPPLVAKGPVGQPDITTPGRNLDVKTMLANAREFQVNRDSHLKVDKSITHYWFVRILSQTLAEYWVFHYNDVSSWEVKDSTYSPIYFKPIPTNGQ